MEVVMSADLPPDVRDEAIVKAATAVAYWWLGAPGKIRERFRDNFLEGAPLVEALAAVVIENGASDVR